MYSRIFTAAALIIAASAVGAQDAAKAAAKPAPPVPAALSAPATGPAATVNGVAIPRQRAELLLRERTQQGQPDSEQLRAAIRDELINREIISQEAARSGLTKRADLQTELELVRQTVVVQAYLRDWIRQHPVTDAEVQKEYDSIKLQLGEREYRARHILVGTETEAKSVIAELGKGGKFDEIARKSSKDDGTRDKGGDLDWQAPATFDKDFSVAMVKLTKGRYSENPVKTRFGYHIIQLDDIRPIKHPPLSEVKPNLLQRLQRNKIEKLIGEMRARAKIE